MHAIGSSLNNQDSLPPNKTGINASNTQQPEQPRLFALQQTQAAVQAIRSSLNNQDSLAPNKHRQQCKQYAAA